MGKTKRKLSSWNLFVQKIHKANPGKPFKVILKMASTLKKQGKMGVNSLTSMVSPGKRKTKRRR